MAQSLLFGWISVYMYEGDAPLAERRAAALALDRDLLRELLGAEELRELIDPAVLADLEAELQRLVEGRQARDLDELHDLLRILGPLALDEVMVRTAEGFAGLDGSASRPPGVTRSRRAAAARRGASGHRGGRGRRTALGRRRGRRPGCATGSAAAIPVGLPNAFTDPVDAPARRPRRSLRPHPRTVPRPARSPPGSASTVPACVQALERLQAEGRVVRGEFRPDGIEREWCDDDVLRQLRRRSLAVLRAEVEPVDVGRARPGSCPSGRASGLPRRGLDGLVEVPRRAAGRRRAGVGAGGRPAAGPHGRLPARRPRRPVHRR